MTSPAVIALLRSNLAHQERHLVAAEVLGVGDALRRWREAIDKVKGVE